MNSPKKCSIDNCESNYYGCGYCGKHYRRWRLYGDPLAGGYFHKDARDMLDRLAKEDCGDRCIIWPYRRLSSGYGSIKIDGVEILVSRYLCEARNGKPPTSKHEAAHCCGNGREGCVNPRHLRWATHAENMADTILHGTNNPGEDHPNAKLTDEAVLAIRAARGRISQRALAKRFGVSQTVICRVSSRKGWKHVGQ